MLDRGEADAFLLEPDRGTQRAVYQISVELRLVGIQEIQAEAFDLGLIPYIHALGRDGTAEWLTQIRDA